MTEAEHARRTPSPQRGEGWGEGAPAVENSNPLRHDWTRAEVRALFDLPFPDLMFRAQSVHRANFDPGAVQISTLLSIKTGGCPEDCAYCPQSASYDTGVRADKLMALDAVLAEARAAKAGGASRFCMGAAWREPKDRDLDSVCAMVEGVKALGLETCATLGMLTAGQARRLKDSGLDFYNHNLDTSPEFYEKIITTRTYQDRLETLDHVRDAGIHVCCGGIVGMGETPRGPRRHDRDARRACRRIRNRCRSTCWCASPARRSPPSRRSIRSNSCAPSRSPASPCRARWCGSPPAART